MIYFNKQFIDFFSKLEKNNSRDWFIEHKSKYEENVKNPFEVFVGDLIKMVQKHERGIDMTAKQAIFRINKDTRFSKDKSPYKTSMSAAVSAGGRNPEYPGIYVEMNNKHVLIIGGSYMLEKPSLEKVRNAIVKNRTLFSKLIKDKKFKDKFGEILGEKNKLLPPKFKAIATSQPLIANKQFYFQATLPPFAILSDDFLKTLESYYLACRPVNKFLVDAGFK